MAVLVRNVSVAEDVTDVTIPTRPDGSFYRFEMVCDGGWTRVYDDTVTGLLGHLIPGYPEMDLADQLAARIRHAVDTQVQIQARLNTFYAAAHRTYAEQDILLGPRHTPPVVDVWLCTVPLVVVDAFYAPYSALPRPASGLADVADSPNVWWLTPAQGEWEYLRSLHETSAVDLHMAKEEAI